METIQVTLELLAKLLATMFIVTATHELGHYFAARAFGMKVERVVIWFDNSFYLLRVHQFTLGWIPLGGYVSVPEITDRPKGQRVIVMLAGSLANFLLVGLLIATGLDHSYFFFGVGLVSIVTGALNLLPVPSFDGGQVALVLYEWIFKKPAESKFVEWLWCGSTAVLLGLAVYLIIF